MDRMSVAEAREVLGLVGEGEKTEHEIRRAYRTKSLATHPDKNPVSPDPACLLALPRDGSRSVCARRGMDCGGVQSGRYILIIYPTERWEAGYISLIN